MTSVPSLSRFFAFTVCLIGSLGALGWHKGLSLLGQINERFIPMAPLTAIVFFVMGLSLYFMDRVRVHARGLMAVSTLYVSLLLVLVAVLGRFFGVWAVDVENVFYSNPDMFGNVAKARMSPLTALNFLLSSVALLLFLHTNAKSIVAQALPGSLVIASMCAAVTIILGYAYGTPLLYGGTTIPMALTTAVGFLLLSITVILAAGPERFPLRSLLGDSARAILLRSFLPVSIAGISVHGFVVNVLAKGTLLNHALISALSALAFGLVTSIITIQVARRIGGQLDAAHKARQRAERDLGVFSTAYKNLAREIDRLELLKRFFSPQVAETLISNRTDNPLQSHRGEVTVAFVDLRGFTAFAEAAEPATVLGVLEEYFAAVGNLVLRNDGTIGGTVGDGMVVFFNDPVPIPDHSARATKVALEVRQVLNRLKADWHKKSYQLDFGMGLASGEATIGAIGFDRFWDYTVIGNTVNMAARLCSQADKGEILMSHKFYSSIEDKFVATSKGLCNLKGIQQDVHVYNVVEQKTQ